VSFEDLFAGPFVVPVPKLDGHVVGRGEYVGLDWVDGDRANVVGVGLEHVDPLEGVVVEDADLHVVGAGDDPVLAGDEFGGANWRLADLE